MSDDYRRTQTLRLPISVGGAQPLPPRATEESEARQWSSSELLAGGREVLIRHGQETYRLRSTNKGGLILTK